MMLINSFQIQEENETKFIAKELSKLCCKGDVLAINGKMGAGKTTFIKYFIKNITNVKNVPSPSYNLILPYESTKTIIYHMDVWRLKSYKEALSLGIEEMFEQSIFLIEWAEKIKEILPKSCLKLDISNIKGKKTLKLEGNESWKIRLEKINKNVN